MIALAIHTPEHAAALRNILESHGVTVSLENYVVPGNRMIVAEKVLVAEEDLPLALQLVESGESLSALQTAMKMAGMSRTLLIPVDFSESSLIALRVGFSLAERLGAAPVVLHCCQSPMLDSAVSANPFSVEPDETGDMMFEQEAIAGDVRKQQEIKLRALKKRIKDAQQAGEIENVKFRTELVEGVPEEAILTWSREKRPELVVMATRGIHKKEEDLIGSVTAEVLDSCRVPVLTVPENHSVNFGPQGAAKSYVMFCSLDQHDIFTVDNLMRMFSYPACNVVLVPVPSKSKTKIKSKIEALCRFLTENYPASSFSVYMADERRFREEIDALIKREKTDLLIVPNKKTNIFSRIFHPTIAHRFLFERDMPMLVLPV